MTTQKLSFKFIPIIVLFFITFLGHSAENFFLSASMDWSTRESVFRIDNTFSRYEIRHKGKILVTDDDRDIKSISPNGYLIVERSSFGRSRRLELRGGDQGEVIRYYFEGNRRRDFEPHGQNWLAEIMEDAIYKTGIGGKERVMRIYHDRGVRGVLREVNRFSQPSSYSRSGLIFSQSTQISGHNARNLYLKTLVDEVPLSYDELVDVIDAIAGIVSNSTKGTLLRTLLEKYTMDSFQLSRLLKTTQTLSFNTERGNVLRKLQSVYKLNEVIFADYLRVINGMNINSEKGNVLKPLLNSQELSDELMIALIRAVGNFSSDSEKAAVLRLVANKMSDNRNVVGEYMRVVSGMGNSYRLLREELMDMASFPQNHPDINKAGVLALLDMAMGYQANTQKTRALRRVIPSLDDDPEIIESFFDVVHSINNEMEKYNLMLDLIYAGKLSYPIQREILQTAEAIAARDYKHGASAILRELIPHLPKDGSLDRSFFTVLKHIDHDSAKEEIIRMFCQMGLLDANLTVLLLSVVGDINVDIEKATSLILIYHRMPQDENLKYIFDSVLKTIESGYDYERVVLATGIYSS